MAEEQKSFAGKVLIVDDDPMIRLLAGEALAQYGFQVRAVADGSQVDPILSDYTPDIILLDVLMPEMDGYTTCAKLRASAHGADIPVLMMTGLDDLEAIQNAYTVGATDFIGKPIHWQVLPHRVQYIIRSNLAYQELKASKILLGQTQQLNQMLFAIADAVNSTEDLQELYKRIHHILGSVLDVTNFFIAIVDHTTQTLSFPYHVDTIDEDFSPHSFIDTESTLTGIVVREKKSILLRRKELLEREKRQGIWGPSPLIWMGCPLLVQDEVIGVLAAQSYTDGDIYDEGDLQLLTAVSQQIAVAIARKQFLDKLQESEERLNLLVKNSSDSFTIIDPDGIQRYISPAAERITGYPIADLEGKNIDILIHPDDKEAVMTAWNEVVKHPNKSVTVQCRHIHKTKGWVDIEVLGQSFLNEPAIQGVITNVRDITEYKRTENTLKEHAAFRERVFDSSHLPIIIMDADTLQYIDCNPAAATIYGHASREETLGKTPMDVSPLFQYDGSSSWEKIQELVMTALKEGQLNFEWLHQRTNGEQWDGEVHLMSFKLGERQLIQFTLQDITERKRTAALMIQTEKMMMVGGLAAGMAHEINNPLGIITQAAQVIQRRIDPTIAANQEVAGRCRINLNDLNEYLRQRQLHDFLGNIRSAVTRAAKIISNMLAFSRKSDPFSEEIELPKLFDQTLELASADYDLQKNYGFKQIIITKEYADNLPKITVTVVEIEQVLINLLKNSTQALHQAGTKTAKITMRARAEKGFAIIEIEDNGPGMSPEIQKRIFEPFFTTKSVGIGTGLGLSISHAIITNNHHGSLEVHSQPGVGTCFTIRLPLILSAHQNTHKYTAADSR